MKLKIIGVTAFAALVMLAFAASALGNAKVCSTEGTGEECEGSHGWVYSGEIDASLETGNSATLTATNSSGGSVSTVTCTTSTVKGTVDGNTGTGSISSFTFANCSSSACPNGVTATTTASSSNTWPATAITGSAPNGSLAVEKVQGQFVCGSFFGNITCVYSTSKATTQVTGSDTEPHVTATNVPLALVSGNTTICGVKADWSGTYRVTTPESLFLT